MLQGFVGRTVQLQQINGGIDPASVKSVGYLLERSLIADIRQHLVPRAQYCAAAALGYSVSLAAGGHATPSLSSAMLQSCQRLESSCPLQFASRCRPRSDAPSCCAQRQKPT